MRNTSAIQSTLNTTTPFATNYGVGIQGFEATGTGPTDSIALASVTSGWNPTLSTAVPGIPGSASVVAGSDLMVIRRVSDTGYRLVPPYNDSAQIFVESGATFQAGEILIATDCAQATVFQLTSTNSGGANITNLVHSAATKTKGGGAITPGNSCVVWGTGCTDPGFGPGSEIAKALTTIFYIRQDGTDALPALYMATSSSGDLGPGTKLVDGVESMQILYGIDSTAVSSLPGTPPTPLWFDRAERYMTADQINSAAPNLWPNVVTVRISLLMRTVNEPNEQADQSIDSKTYILGGTQITPVSDQNRRRVFVSTVQIRNRILPSGN
ncbi:MAG TPA: hypothetical protein ENG78_01815 [Acidiferrobacteraceae bacterium]|nr:hypothetical protein [Acidiferrobacteraceae bacterium]HEX19548.1 hypothetical protein [Acidiferrobacteraceae bacterium]